MKMESLSSDDDAALGQYRSMGCELIMLANRALWAIENNCPEGVVRSLSNRSSRLCDHLMKCRDELMSRGFTESIGP
jgi:hypothetical protein